MPATIHHFDRRATHKVISAPVALDSINDIDALAQEAISYLEPAHLLALGHQDPELVRALVVAHGRVNNIREICHEGAALLEQSFTVDPYRAIQASPDAA